MFGISTVGGTAGAGASTPVGGLSIIFEDLFTETVNTILSSHTPTGPGTGWTEEIRTGTHFLRAHVNNYCRASGSEDSDENIFSAQATYGGADYQVECDFHYEVTPADTDNPFFIFVRLLDSDNYYAVGVWINTSTTIDIELFKNVTGTKATIGSALTNQTYDIETDAGITVKLSVVGTTLKVFINGSEVMSETDSALGSTGEAAIGIGACRNSTDDIDSNWTPDNFVVKE